MTGHDKAHYAMGAAALLGVALIFGGNYVDDHRTKKADKAPITFVHQGGTVSFAEAGPKPNRFAWPVLGQEKTTRLGERLGNAGPTKALLFCGGENCKGLEADLDDAFQIAGWTDDEESTAVLMGGGGEGLLVGPPGPKAEALRAALTDVGLGPVEVVRMNVRDFDVGLIIAKRPTPR